MKPVLLNEKNVKYWADKLHSPFPEFSLLAHDQLPASESMIGKESFTLSIEPQAMDALSKRLNKEIFMLSVYCVFLYRMTHEEDMVIGICSQEGELLPLRMTCADNDTFAQVYQRVADLLEQAQAHPLAFADIERLIEHSLTIRMVYGKDRIHENTWINWAVEESQGQWTVDIAYLNNRYDKRSIVGFFNRFQGIVTALVNRIDVAIGSIDMSCEEDRDRYTALNDTTMKLPDGLTLVERFSAIVSEYSNQIALSTEDKSLSYQQLDALSNRVAHLLQENGLHKGDFVTIFMERSIETVISLLGVIKAGGAYIPLDPGHPEERNGFIIEDSATRIILTKAEHFSKVTSLLGDKLTTMQIFQVDQQLTAYSDKPCLNLAEPNDTAYVIYTSGSTGKPKGALVAHKGVVNLALALKQVLKLTDNEIILQYSTFSFDASVCDLFSALLNGSRLHLLSDEERYSIDSFTDAIVATGATRISILPTVFFNRLAAYLTMADADKFQSIKSIVVGGEALAGEAVRMLQRKIGLTTTIVNAYGPTECTAVATTHTIDYAVADHVSGISIGKPLNNYELYIVNSYNQLCPVGVVGELLISSIGVGKGYWNQPQKTAEAFINDPIELGSGKCFYRTGDMVRLSGEGLIEYVGRKDSQVKIRGYRIEIGEIEDNLAKHLYIKDAVVISRADSEGNAMLVAFYTTKDGKNYPEAGLVQFLGSKLPSYMIPQHFCFLDNMPVTPTGKINRNALKTIELTLFKSNTEYTAPENALQQEILSAWQKVLDRLEIGIHDDFFAIGGHSLKIMGILVQLKPHHPKLKIADFFSFPTIALLAARIESLEEMDTTMETLDIGEMRKDLSEFPLVLGPISDEETTCLQQHILLTGATGYLGSHLLWELLHKTESRVYCLIRPTGQLDPRKRLVKTMIGYFGAEANALISDRVVVVSGDLEQDELGLNADAQALLLTNIDSIIHCGAEVKHFGDQAYFTKVNVDSTARLLALAKRKKDTRFHYVSTMGIPEELAFGGDWEQFIRTEPYDYSANLENVYTNSKLEAEKLVVRACSEGMLGTIYRIGNLSCRSDNGSFQQNIDNNAFYRMLKAMILLKAAPIADWHVDFTPIDYAGKSISELVMSKKTVGQLFHICNPVQLPHEQMVGFFQDYGYSIDWMKQEEYEAWLLNVNQSKNQEGLEMAMAQLEGDGAKSTPFRFACPQTTRLLEGTGVVCPSPDAVFFTRMIDYAVQLGYFPEPDEYRI
ncbi:MAG: amino acid adenylation domain-containing protein [Gorillibacterium sp.]|nr:amino acid adenylation domain-containing protein [Gorillibacterium sp.]